MCTINRKKASTVACLIKSYLHGLALLLVSSFSGCSEIQESTTAGKSSPTSETKDKQRVEDIESKSEKVAETVVEQQMEDSDAIAEWPPRLRQSGDKTAGAESANDNQEKVFHVHQALAARRGDLGWLYIGMHGELIPPASRVNPADESVFVVPKEDGGLRLIPGYPDYPNIYADVSPDGAFSITEWGRSRSSATLTPTKWPFRDGAGNLAFPPSSKVLSSAAEEEHDRLDPPAESIGWMFMDASGELYRNHIKLEPFANILWVVKKGDGLEIVHSGPLHEGVYASVSSDLRILWSADSGKALPPEREGDYWPAVMESGELAMVGTGTTLRKGMKNIEWMITVYRPDEGRNLQTGTISRYRKKLKDSTASIEASEEGASK